MCQQVSDITSPSPSPPSPKWAVLLAKLRKTMFSAWTTIGTFNSGIAERFKTSGSTVVKIEIGGLATLGFTMMQIGEWAVSIAFWVAMGFILIAKAIAWEPANPSRYRSLLKILYPLGALAICVTLILVADLRKPNTEPWSNLQKLVSGGQKPPCSILIEVNSEIVADVHSRAMWLPSGSTEVVKSGFQDLFHDWTIKVTPANESPAVVISVKDLQRPNDRIRTIPEVAQISAPQPKWLSGFDEPSQTPDFYIRTIKFEKLDKSGNITIRRPIKSRTVGGNSISPLDLNLDRTITASAGSCKVDFKSLSLDAFPLSTNNLHFKQLITELRALLKQKIMGGTSVETRLDPDQPYPPLNINESEIVSEIKCADTSCEKMTVELKEHTRIQ